MADVQFTNFVPQSTTHPFSVIWKLTRAMKKAGWTYKASGDGTNKDTTGTASNDKWGGNADPANDTYPTALDSVGAWWCCQGPGTVRVPITTTPTGTFIRGERVTQVDGSDGEFQGYVINAAGNSGWAVVKLRSATTTWTGTGTVTGATSGATLTPSTTPKIYIRQFVFWKNSANTTQGSIYYICADQSGESASLFTTLAGNADCSASIAPGGKAVLNSGNNLPTLAIVVHGKNTSVLNSTAGAVTHQQWFAITSSLGNAQIVAMNATPTTGSSGTTADATFWMVQDNNSSQGTFSGQGYFILDDTEQGDQDPYAYWKNWASAAYLQAGDSGTPGTITTTNMFPVSNGGASVTWPWNGYCARGTGGSKDVGTGMVSGVDVFNGMNTTGQPSMTSNSGDSQRVANHPDGASAPILREPVRVWSDRTGFKIRKGSARWMAIGPLGASLDTTDTKQWLIVLGLSGVLPTILLGKYDGSTTPTP